MANPAIPSIKGTGLQQVVLDVWRALAEGRVAREELEARLAPEDLALLEPDAEVQAAQWYPNACHRRLTELLRDVEGGGSDEYVIARGAATAERLMAAGLYSQVRYADERSAGSMAELTRAARLMLTLSGALYSFGKWSLRTDPEKPRSLFIDVTEAEPLSEMNRLTAHGFIEELTTRLSEHPVRVESRRDGPDRVTLVLQADERTPL
jgi:hypothetical protein